MKKFIVELIVPDYIQLGTVAIILDRGLKDNVFHGPHNDLFELKPEYVEVLNQPKNTTTLILRDTKIETCDPFVKET